MSEITNTRPRITSAFCRVACSLLAVVLPVVPVACSGSNGGAPLADEWSGTVTTEGDVTTVVNESGSVWGGDVTFVEEASIGVEAGEDAYMLGAVRALWATDDEIYVVDWQVPALRVYDWDGRHLRDLGAEGSGPAEFRRPDSMVIGPDGLVYVRDYGNDRIMVMTAQGDEVGVLPLDGGFGTTTNMVMTVGGTLYNYQRIPTDDPEERTNGMVPRSLEVDEIGAPILPPDLDFESWSLTARAEGLSMTMRVPFAPGTIWTLAPSGAVIAGVSDEYSFEIRYPHGHVTRVVKRESAVPVDPDEADWYRRSTTARMQRNVPEWTWNGPAIPAVKPAFQRFLADHSGRVWVARPGPGYHVEGECTEDPQPGEQATPCWHADINWDVFDDEGRFLGGAEMPEGVGSFPAVYARGDDFVVSAANEMGTIMVKRYRLVYPGDG